jgi:hypothetical protein
LRIVICNKSARAVRSRVEVRGERRHRELYRAHARCGGIQLEIEVARSAITQVTIARNAVGGCRAAGIRLEGPAADVHLVDNTTLGGNAGGSLAVSDRHGPLYYHALDAVMGDVSSLDEE